MASEKTEINFNPKLFNNIFWHLSEAFNDTKVRYIWLYGGSSASKTYTVVQLQIISMLYGADENALILRKFATDIRDSIYSDFKNVIREWELGELFEIQQNYIVCKTGSYVRFRGLDDSEKVKGISNFKRVIMEEVSQFDEVDLKQMRKRLRGKRGQQIIGIFNPISEEHWIKTNIFDLEVLTEVDTEKEARDKKKVVRDWKISGKWHNSTHNTLIFKVNYLDNKYIVGEHYVDQHVIDDLESDKIKDFNYYNIYGLGNWGKIRIGGEFWKDFNANLNVATVPWDEDLPIHLSWDENVNPYLTCLVWQIKGKDATQIDEICLEDPRNRIKHVCMEFRQRYPQSRVKGLFIYGDRTSWKEDAKKEKGENFFTDVLNNLTEYKPQLRLQSSNPSVVQSGQFINEIYARQEGGITIKIDHRCKRSIHDYQYALEDSDGTIKKTKKTNPVTKVSYEEFGHCFVGETMITTQRGQVRIDEVNVGDFALTRKGFKKISKVFINGKKRVNDYVIGGSVLRCTENHKVFVNNIFISVNLIHNGIFCIFDKKTNTICYQKLSLTTDSNSKDTQSQKTGLKGFITQVGLANTKNDFTGIFTNAKLALLKKECTFITRMKTLSIMIFQILRKKKKESTCQNTITQKQTNKKHLQKTTLLKRLSLVPKYGTLQKRGLIGTENTQKTALCPMLILKKTAPTAPLTSKQKLSDKNTAQQDVIINTKQGDLESVYDLQVEDEHEYFANGVLVHNCSDAKRYILTMVFANEYQNYLKGGRPMRIGVGKNTSKHRY